MSTSASATKRNESVSKALQIVEVMAEADGPMRLQDIGSRVGLPPSTVLRFLKTLTDHDYVQQNPETLQYFLTLKFCHLSDRVQRQTKLRDIVRPYLVELSRSLEEASSLAVERDMLVVYLDCVEGPDHMLQTLQRIGKIAPMNSTGVGKALLLDYDDAKLERLVSERGLPKPTIRTISSLRSLKRELGEIRERGYATDDEECEGGVRCVAVPLRDHSGAIVAAISTSGPLGRMPDARITSIGRDLVETAQEISSRLGYHASSDAK